MVNFCCAYGCTNVYNPTKRVSFHTFPLNQPELLQRWVNAVRREDWYPTKTSRICSEHFLPTDYEVKPGTSQRRLKNDATPSVFSFLQGLPEKATSPHRKILRRWFLKSDTVYGSKDASDNIENMKCRVGIMASPEEMAYCRSEQSLASLTKKFIDLINNSEDGVLNLKKAAQSLAISSFRRIYDITAVLEGLGLIEKPAVNSVQWKKSESNHLLRQEVEQLKNHEQALILYKSVIESKIQDTINCSDTKKYLYVTNEDLANCFGDDTVVVLKTVVNGDSQLFELEVKALQNQGSFELGVKSLKSPIVATTIVQSEFEENKQEGIFQIDSPTGDTTGAESDSQTNFSEDHTDSATRTNSIVSMFEELETLEQMEYKCELAELLRRTNVCDSDSRLMPAVAVSSDLNQPNDRGYEVGMVNFNKMKVDTFHGLSTDVKSQTVSVAEVEAELKKKQRQWKNRVAARTSRNSKKVHLEQMEKHIQELLSKNQSLVARCTDLNNLNKSLQNENAELHNKIQKTNNSPSHGENAELNNKIQKTSLRLVGDCDPTSEESTVHPNKQKISSTDVLSTQALADLWNEIASTPLPQCRCSKLCKTSVKKRVHHKRKL